ncbi:MAG: ribosomal RNA small subunit methyltransferase A [Clostridia bacterium]|nr:ribosomal RNA small subunit methyltransferase A [Clostridia bacterium]
MDQELLPAVRDTLQSLGLRPSKLRGQNFLVSGEVSRHIVALAALQPQLPIIEIGAGLGSLSRMLAEYPGRLELLEIEPLFVGYLAKLLSDRPQTRIIEADALCFNYVSHYRRQEYQIFGNIPYNITSALIEKLLKHGGNWRRMYLLLQKEAAERLVDGAKRQNGPLPLMLDYFAESEILFHVPEDAFYPRPAVRSAIIAASRKEGTVAGEDFYDLFRFIEAAFAQRRKTLANNLCAVLGGSRGFWQELIKTAGLPEQVRAEALSLADFKRLFALFGRSGTEV